MQIGIHQTSATDSLNINMINKEAMKYAPLEWWEWEWDNVRIIEGEESKRSLNVMET